MIVVGAERLNPTVDVVATTQRTSFNDNEDVHLSLSTTSPVSASVGVGSALTTIFRRAPSSVAFCARLVLVFYIAKATWDVAIETWDEIQQDLARSRRHVRQSGDDNDLGEEQDLPYADMDGESDEVENNDNPGAKRKDSGLWRRRRRRRRRKSWQDENMTPTIQNVASHDLAERLRCAGIPRESDLISSGEEDNATNNDDDDDSLQHATVERIMRSLTRVEGNVLSQTLLSPPREGVSISPVEATAAWNDIGGLGDAKESLLDLAFPLLPRQSLASSDDGDNDQYYGGLLANPPGVLLFGPPGCGKTMLVRALASTVGARFLVVSPSCLLRKYVGETNLNVRALFSVARKVAPTVIFVDELDGLFRERGGEDHDVGRDLKTEFLQLWEGVRRDNRDDKRGGSSILIIGATNRPFDVDPAFLRRMPRRIYVGPPDYDSRVAVLRRMLDRVPIDLNFDIDLVARMTEGYSPSDIRELLQAAALYPLREARAEAISSSQGINALDRPLRRLCTDDVLNALRVARPTQFSRRYQKELMSYLQKSGGSIGIDEKSDLPSITERDTKDEEYSANNTKTYGGENFNQGESDSDCYGDDESSESDYD